MLRSSSRQTSILLEEGRIRDVRNHGQEPGSSEGLPSEHLRANWLPRVLSTRDLTVLCLFSVLLVSNVPFIAAAGGASFWYWCLGFLAFLIPTALIGVQLYRLFPGEGAVYLWANKAFGSFWDTFIGLFCNWFPGALGLTIEAGAVVTYIQALNANWLTLPWQQGTAEILVLVLAQVLCTLNQRALQKILNVVFFAYSSCFILLGLAGLAWVLAGHAPQGDFTAQGWQLAPATWPTFATVIVSLLGLVVPLNLGSEVINQHSGRRYMLWGVVITIVGYFIATFGVLVVLPPKDLFNPAFIAEIFTLAFGAAIGPMLGTFMHIILVVYFICATAAFNLIFARLLMVAGVDRRLPLAMQRLNRQRVPWNAMLIQTLFNIAFVIIIFFLSPLFAPTIQGLSSAVFLVTINGASVIWNIAMIGLFLCGIILFFRYKRQLRDRWIAPPLVLYIAALLGIVSAGSAIYSTFFVGSPVPQILTTGDWDYWVLLVVLASLAVGAAYSFLVPEVEDLMALFGTHTAQPSAPESSPQSSKEAQDAIHQLPFQSNAGQPAQAPRGNSYTQNPSLSGQLFPGAPDRSGAQGHRNVPGRMG
ncbi:MAG: APC family permease [Ktedonobacteraceae bacterium]